MQVVFEDDLLDACTAGSRISVVGIYTAQPPKAVGNISGVTEAVLLANSVRPLSHEPDSHITAVDIRYQPSSVHLTAMNSQQLCQGSHQTTALPVLKLIVKNANISLL